MTSIFIKKEAVFFVTISIVPGLASGWVFGENFHWGINGWIAGFVGGWLICFISILKIYSVKLNFLLNINRPYQRFLASLNNSIWVIYALAISISMGLVSALVFGDSLFDDHLLYWLFDDELTFGGRFSPLLQTVFYVSIYISQFPQHFSLRLLLYLEGKMPLRVVTFMDRMSGQHIFEDNRADKKDKNSKPRLDPDGKPLKMRGATWRFRHKILQDYFARLA